MLGELSMGLVLNTSVIVGAELKSHIQNTTGPLTLSYESNGFNGNSMVIVRFEVQV